MYPIVHGVEADYVDQIDFVYLNISRSGGAADAAARYAVRGTPTFVLTAPDGTQVQRWVGGVFTGFDLRDALDAYLEG